MKRSFCPLIKSGCRDDCMFRMTCDDPHCRRRHCAMVAGLRAITDSFWASQNETEGFYGDMYG